MSSDRNDSAYEGFAEDLQLARDGDRQALDRLLRWVETRLEPWVGQEMSDALRSRARASDLIQSVHLEILRSLPNFSGDSPATFCAWMGRILANQVKRQERHFSAQKRTEPGDSEARRERERELQERVSTPSNQLARTEDQDLVRAALDRLTPDHREIIQLVLIEGMSHADAATHLDRAEGAVRTLLWRARAKLAIILEQVRRERGEISGWSPGSTPVADAD